jgi:hypothetical protein
VYEQRDSRIQFNYSNRNEFRLPDYHKLDININYSFTYKTYPIEVFLNLQNVYNRKNAFAQYISFDTDEKTGVSSPKLKQITLMPFIPTLGFSIKL